MGHVVLCCVDAMCQILDFHMDSQGFNLVLDNISMNTVYDM